ncbi:hypothetical protein BGW37DRAFT_519702 [Umbelopsis sp. PMI_123]|nr:hypothetical protein BGW37DRAFT_519702 [Umbelopsis sp. PMI_123]
MKHLTLFIILLLCAVCFTQAQDEKTSSTKPKLLVYHKLTPKGDFIKRGEIVYDSRKSGAAYTHTNPEQFSLDISSPNALYQVKVVDEASQDIVLSSVKSCQLAASGFRDQFIVHVNESGDFTHVDYYSIVSDCFEGAPTESSEFTTSVEVVRPNRPIRPTLGKLTAVSQKSQQPAAAEEGSEADKPEEEKTFFQKYWYVLLGVAVMVLTSASQEPPATQGQGARR